MSGSILFVTGASGSGKTAALRMIETEKHPGLRFHSFDSMGVPGAQEMEREHGSPEGWQANATRLWVDKLAGQAQAGLTDILEGQTRPSFIRSALDAWPGLATGIILLDCSTEVRVERLGLRGQPELATGRMESWAAYLRGQADALGLVVIDTSDMSLSQVAQAILAEARLLGPAPRDP